MLECPHRCMHDQFCLKFLNHHCCTRVMEIMWDIPLSLNHWPNQHPNIYHVQPFYKLCAKIPTHHKPWPGMRISILALGRKQKKKKKKVPNQRSEENKKEKSSRSKIGRKQKKKKVPGQRSKENKGKKKIPDQRSEENERIIHKGLWTRQISKQYRIATTK